MSDVAATAMLAEMCDLIALDIVDDDALACPEGITDYATTIIRPGVARIDLTNGVPVQLRQHAAFDFLKQVAKAEAARIYAISGNVWIAESLAVNPLLAGPEMVAGETAWVTPNAAIRSLVMTAAGGPAVVSVTLLGRGAA